MEQYTLKLYNNLTHSETSYTVSDLGDSEIYYHFENLNIDLPDGEYSYKVYSTSNILLASGLARVGEIINTNTEYNGNKQYKEYRG